MGIARRFARALVTPEGRHRLRRRLASGKPWRPAPEPPPASDPRAQQSVADYHHLVTAFKSRVAALGHTSEIENFCWYHTIELPGGLVTPGSYDYRTVLPNFGFPADMSGMRVLDIGSATGFFAFEFERRGAMVTSVDVPSMAAWDVFPGETPAQTLAKQERGMPNHIALTDTQRAAYFGEGGLDRIQHLIVDGPFTFCHRLLGSKVQRHYSRIYELSPAVLSQDGYDLVFVGDVLLHTINPLGALAAAAALCRGTLVIAQALPGPDDAAPSMLYVGGEVPGYDDITWWLPNLRCMEQMLRKLGFREVRVTGRNIGYLRPGGVRYDRTILHATR